MWSHLYHAQSFWNFRHLPNIHCVHYADLKADREGEMRRIARFLDIDVPESTWPALVERDFFFKGTNGRWRDVRTREDPGVRHGGRVGADAGVRRVARARPQRERSEGVTTG